MILFRGGGSIHIPRDQRRGVHEMTLNDHEGEGSRNDHVVIWNYMYFCVRSEKKCVKSQSEQLHGKF